MAKLTLKKGATDVSVYLFAQDSSVTTGAGLTGLTFETASLVAYYVRPLGSATAITLATQTVTGAHSDGGFVEVDATNMPGVYRFDLPDAVCATGVPSVVVMLKGATNLTPVALEIQLTDFDLNSTSNSVGAVASVTAGVTLADDAITSAKYDEVTAFPYVEADVFDSNTLLSIPVLGGYDVADVYRLLIQMLTGEQPSTNKDGTGLLIMLSDITTTETLPSLDDKLAAIQADLDAGFADGIAGDIWSYAKRTLTHPSVSAEEPEDSNTLILYRDADIAIELTDLTIPAGAKKYIFTIKDNLDSGDDQAVLQASYAIDGSEVETNTLVYINSAAAPVLTNPVTFTLTDTNITIDLTAEAAALLPRYERGYLNWDLKLVTDAAVTIVLQGLAQIIGTSTRAIE